MTDPNQSTTSIRGYRTYTDPTDPIAVPVISITSAIKAGLPKHLDDWKIGLGVDRALAEPNTPRKSLVATAAEYAKAAAARGDVVHDALEHFPETGKVRKPTSLDLATQAYADAVPYLDQLEQFLEAWPLKFVWSEFTVYGTVEERGSTLGYAGTSDLLAEIPGKGLGIIDLKTSKRAYAEAAIQISAARYADYAVRVNDEGEYYRVEIPPVDFCAVMLIGEDSFDLVEVDAGPAQFEEFARCVGDAAWSVGAEKRVILGPIEPPKIIEVEGPSPLYASTRERITMMIEAGFEDDLLGAWPDDLPMLSKNLDEFDLRAVKTFVDRAYGHLEDKIPFGEHDVDPWRASRAPLLAELAADMKKLPEDLLASMQAVANKAGASRLDDLDEPTFEHLNLALGQAKAEMKARRGRLVAAAEGPFEEGDEILDDLLVWIGGGKKPKLFTGHDVEVFEAVCWAVENLNLVPVFDEEGGAWRLKSGLDLKALEAFFGTKSEANRVAKAEAKRLGLDAPRSAAALLEAPFVLALALFAHTNDGLDG